MASSLWSPITRSTMVTSSNTTSTCSRRWGRFVSLEEVASYVTDRRHLPPSHPRHFRRRRPERSPYGRTPHDARGIPAALFVVTDLIGSNDVIWTIEVEQLVASGGRTSVDPTANGRALVRVSSDPRSRPPACDRRTESTASMDRPRPHSWTTRISSDSWSWVWPSEPHHKPPVSAPVLRRCDRS